MTSETVTLTAQLIVENSYKTADLVSKLTSLWRRGTLQKPAYEKYCYLLRWHLEHAFAN
jgi:hypothetical protein